MLSHYTASGKGKKLSVFPQDPTCPGAACLKALVPAGRSSAVAASALKNFCTLGLQLFMCVRHLQLYPSLLEDTAYLVQQETFKVPHLQSGIVLPNQATIFSCSPD